MMLTKERIEEFRELARTGKGEVNFSAADMRDLCDLALIGAAVKPRPIEEAPLSLHADCWFWWPDHNEWATGALIVQSHGAAPVWYRWGHPAGCSPTHFVRRSALPDPSP